MSEPERVPKITPKKLRKLARRQTATFVTRAEANANAKRRRKALRAAADEIQYQSFMAAFWERIAVDQTRRLDELRSPANRPERSDQPNP